MFSVLNICSSHEVSWSDEESRMLLGDSVAGSSVQFNGEGVNVSEDECELARASSDVSREHWKSLYSSRWATKASRLQANTSSRSASFSRSTLLSKLSRREHFFSRYCRCSLFFSLLWWAALLFLKMRSILRCSFSSFVLALFLGGRVDLKLVGIAEFDCESLVSSKSVISIAVVVVKGSWVWGRRLLLLLFLTVSLSLGRIRETRTRQDQDNPKPNYPFGMEEHLLIYTG